MMKRSMILTLAAAICVSISCGPSDDDAPGGGQAAELPTVDGLNSDADNQRLRFYVDTSQDAPGLYAFDPTQPEGEGVLVDDDLSVLQPHFAVIPSGTFDEASGRVTDYQNAHLYYTVSGTPPSDSPMSSPVIYGEQRRVSTDPATLGEEPARVSTTTLSSTILSSSARFRAYDLQDPLQSSLVIRTPSQGWVRVRPSYDATRDPDAFGESVEVISSIWGPDARQNAGWLVFDTDTDDGGNTGVLERFDDDLNPVGAVRYKDSGEVVTDVKNAKYMHDFADGTLLVALGIDDDTAGEVWLYESASAPDEAGTIEPLLSSQGEPLLISFAPMGIDGNDTSFSPPSTNLTSVTNEAYYFAQGPGLMQHIWTHLFRIDHDGWAAYDHEDYASADGSSIGPVIDSALAPFLVQVGPDQLFWTLAGQNEVVDVSSPTPSEWTRTPIDAPGGRAEDTPVYSSANGWVYYNTGDDEAVALNVDSGASVALDDTRWIGASASGTTTALNGRVDRAGISEVFALRHDRQLTAVSAAAPLEGMVVLGDLDAPADEVHLFGASPGPHRLAQVAYDDDTFEVVYMNTRHKDSLRALTAAPVSDWEMPLDNGSSLTVSASGTRPVGRF